jgi:hypothetical protein
MLAGDGADHIVGAALLQIRAMTIRVRKLIGTIALFALVAAWSFVAMALAQSVLTDINGFVAVMYYVVAGLGWVVPAMLLVKWMGGPGVRNQ